MNLKYDKQSDSVYIKLVQSNYSESDEINEGVILDYDEKKKIIGIEILNASKRLSPNLFKGDLLVKSKFQLKA